MKKSILIAFSYYWPAFKAGGPIQSLKNLTNILSEEYEITVLALNHDIDGTLLTVNNKMTHKGVNIIYSDKPYSFLKLYGFVRMHKFDYIYLNSFFSWHFAMKFLILAPFIKSKIILAPRGQFSPGALAIGRIKKTIVLNILKYSFVRYIYKIHSTSKMESIHIKNKLGFENKIILAENLKPVNFSFQTSSKSTNSLRLVFLSRISPKKNLSYLIDLLNDIDLDTISLDIYGIVEDKIYWQQCLTSMKKKSHIKYTYKGEILPKNVGNTLRSYDAFAFPTRGENFGHVIAEALMAGLPVLLSDQTPFNELHDIKCGWCIPLDNKNKFKDVITMLYDWDAEQMNETKVKIKEYLMNFEEKQQEVKSKYKFIFAN